MALSDTVRRVPTVERQVGASLLLVAPTSGEVRVLGPTASVVWRELACTDRRDRLVEMIEQTYPDVLQSDRLGAIDEILKTLESDGLVVCS